MLSKGPTFSYFVAKKSSGMMGREGHIRNTKENSYHPQNLIFLEIPSQELEIKTKQVSHITVSNMEHA